MNKLLSVYKPIGKTPLEMIKQVKQKFPEYAELPIGYAGRLDPLAHGVLLLMIGDATKERDAYLQLNKTYDFEILLGFRTDTYDYLGLLKEQTYTQTPSNVKLYVNSFVNSRVGILQQTYPPFSSKSVQGKPLFWWAKEGRLDEITIPHRTIEIAHFTCNSYKQISRSALQDRITRNIQLVQGDFRQKEIIERWDLLFESQKVDSFTTIQCTIACSSGTYIRGLVHELGENLGCGAIAIEILRTSIGEYTEKSTMRL